MLLPMYDMGHYVMTWAGSTCGCWLSKVYIENSNIIVICIVCLLILVSCEWLHDLSLSRGQCWVEFSLNSVQLLHILWHNISPVSSLLLLTEIYVKHWLLPGSRGELGRERTEWRVVEIPLVTPPEPRHGDCVGVPWIIVKLGQKTSYVLRLTVWLSLL